MSTISAGTTSTTTLIASGDTTGSLVFKTNDTGSGGTTAMTIDTSQNVGIGTSSPGSALSFGGAKGLNATAGVPTLRMYDDGTNSFGIAASSSGVSSLDISCNYSAGNIRFFSGGSTASPAERARIDSSGNLLVGGTTSTYGSKLVLYSSGGGNIIESRQTSTGAQYHSIFMNANGAVGSIQTNGSTTSYVTSSDYRLKENIAPMTGALSVVQQLKPCTYTWKADGSDGQGFIAHELQAVVPDCVTGEKDAVDADGNPIYQGIDTSFLVATLTAAIQELKALNDAQASTITQLTERISALENK